ncbi:hypothetical protein AXX12_11405 [Anaerosporomusa subterranea]|uniref:PucR family transcriptional regulator n=1 Tax=Anaerosporomusa subterranea TaxID=1794912 RepID=A0A154BQL5_ANASB|nr:PucR family transcriptional regulator [Anaerosporomusa subterranea]KYZ75798.1 hypothetical protein AXX12_11405 [Anaerosporomusa subterranea]
MLTVNEALQTAALADCVLVGGLGGGNRPIESLNQMDVPDVVDWVAPNQMILTTGYFIRNNVNEQKQLLTDLNDRGCAGLAIKVKRFFRTIPQDMIDLANQLQFPLIEIPADKNISIVMNELMGEIVNKQAALLKHAYDVHNCFTTAVLKGGTLQNISDLLVSFVQNSVVICDDSWNILCQSQSKQSVIALPTILDEINLEDFVKTTRAGDAQPGHQASSAHVNGKHIAMESFPVIHDMRLMGYIFIINTMQTAGVSDRAAIEQAAMVVGLELLKRKIQREMQQNLRADFFNDYLGGNIKSKAVLERRGAQFGINADEKYLCLVFGIDHFNHIFLNTFSGNETSVQKLKKEITHIADNVIEQAGLSISSFSKSDQIVLLLPYSMFAANAKDTITEIVDSIKCEIKQSCAPWLTVSAGIGLAGSAINVSKSYNSALEAMRIGRGSSSVTRDGIYYFEDYIIEYLLADADWSKYEFLYKDTLGQLEDFDRKNAKMELVKTLRTFFDNGFNLSNTAQILYIHRNTLTYRMDKIREIINLDLANNNVRMFLLLMMKMKKVMDNRET